MTLEAFWFWLIAVLWSGYFLLEWFDFGVYSYIAVTLGSAGGTLYIDGVPVAVNAAVALRPSDLGATTNNWIGRSSFAPDPYFTGQMDELRIWTRALSDAEIAALFALR